MCFQIYLFKESRCEVAALNSHVAQQSLLICLLQNVLLDRLVAYQAVDVHVTRLTDTVTPGCGEKVLIIYALITWCIMVFDIRFEGHIYNDLSILTNIFANG